MTDGRKSGMALVAGSLGFILTMAMHPTAAHTMTAEQVRRLFGMSGAVHSIAMASTVLLFLGACGLARSIASADRLSFAAVVTFGFACVAVLVAAAVSGFIIPSIMNDMTRDVPANVQQWRIVTAGIFQVNQAFASIYSVAASLAIILWSISALRNGGFGRSVAVHGCTISSLVILGIGVGHLRMDVHGMAAVVLGQGIWFILVGSQLWSRSPSRMSSQ